MFAKERQNTIYEIISKKGKVSVSSLISMFNVSIETIRRDLLAMEQNGLLTRVHGGAMKVNDMKTFLPLEERNDEFSREKCELSKKAMEFISDNDIISIDSGSTAIAFASEVYDTFNHLKIITHSLDVFNILRKNSNFELVLCGGDYYSAENSFYGPIALSTLENIHVQKAFVFPSAVSLDGIFDYQKDLFLVQKKLIESSGDVYILADSSKFEKHAFLKLCDTKKEYTYVTDSGLSDEIFNLYKEKEFNIYKGEYVK